MDILANNIGIELDCTLHLLMKCINAFYIILLLVITGCDPRAIPCAMQRRVTFLRPAVTA